MVSDLRRTNGDPQCTSSSPYPPLLDVVFLIYMYQRWCYPVDQRRRVDLEGEEAEPDAAASAAAEQQAAPSAEASGPAPADAKAAADAPTDSGGLRRRTAPATAS